MGTLYTQDWRMKSLESVTDYTELMIDEIQQISEHKKLSVDQVIEIYKMAWSVLNRDIWDEQICGIGKELEKLSYTIGSLTDQ